MLGKKFVSTDYFYESLFCNDKLLCYDSRQVANICCVLNDSDAPGKHNFDVLRKLVLPDGSILRARLPGRPTKDSLFTDPSRDGVRCVFHFHH